nr:UvrD-like helicase, ATP-binding domain, P-loop containing nucleoside triphosphate hydrolase [Tanacetum cinerariifolium]
MIVILITSDPVSLLSLINVSLTCFFDSCGLDSAAIECERDCFLGLFFSFRPLSAYVGIVSGFGSAFNPNDQAYGKVVDVFIPNCKSKAGKRFAFVRFIRVVDMDRLIGYMCTLWVGRFHLHTNVVRYERPIKSSMSKRVTAEKPPSSFNHRPSGSYVNAVKDTNSPLIFNHPGSGSPALVLDDSCVNNVDLSRHVMGRVKELNSITNLHNILMKEGFLEVQLSYLGGLWVMMEVKSEKIKRKMLQHTGVNLWFHDLLADTHDLVINERIVWVDIEGLPLNL